MYPALQFARLLPSAVQVTCHSKPDSLVMALHCTKQLALGKEEGKSGLTEAAFATGVHCVQPRPLLPAR